jgi:hypothetical protein
MKLEITSNKGRPRWPPRIERIKHFLGAVIAALTLPLSTAALEPASDLPYYEVEKYCHRQSDIYDRDPTMLTVCLEQEQTSYDKLKKRWSSLDKAVKENCQSAPDVSGSYYKLSACVGRELKDEEELRDFKFRR